MDDILQILKKIFLFNPDEQWIFTNFYFWVFFVIVFAIFSLFHSRILLRNTFLFFASLFFYYKTSELFVLILIFTTFFSYWAGSKIFKAKSEGGKKTYLLLGLIVNLLLLCYFKYSYFLTDVVNDLFGTSFRVFDAFAWLGNTAAGANIFDVDNIMLPVGISFYTFQSISYLMDIYRKRIEPVDNMLNFGFYVSFFPQLVAGPIVRASDFIPQIHKKFFLSRNQFGIAIFWILNGFAKKIILSDYIAVNFVDRVFENPTMYSGFENLVALFGYSLQVYADFSGYTDMAIGVAMLMGFYLPKNFNSPYKAPNPGNFWKRWHISLSKWLQDYLYIPMGGNRGATFGTYCCIVTITAIGVILSGSLWVAAAISVIAIIITVVIWLKPEKRLKIHTNMNSMNTMLLGGIWHGASWNFMIWGGLNGIGMVVFKFWKNRNVYLRTGILLLLLIAFLALAIFYPAPAFNIGVVWVGVIFIGTFIRMVYNLFNGKSKFSTLEYCWAVFQTFVFITFTRLFFRSGSNLDPEEANLTAWNTAKDMVSQIGGKWDLNVIPQMVSEYSGVFMLIVIGMVIHWIPENFKRRYRIWFAKMPLPLMLLAVIVVVFVVYQFITAGLQKFIYFQF
ncbi:MAG: MBOAT family O-acyltransferase [Paludibacteraceae bacterium]|nr:MBOAT family O-acyltransferase [Paludibacteraceae bacterium]